MRGDFDAVGKSSGFQDLLMSLAIEFVNVPPKELEQQIDRALRITGEFTGVDRSYTFLYDLDRQVTSNTHEWCREGIEPMIDVLQDVPFEGLDDWMLAHLLGETMHVPWVEDLPPGSALRNILEPQGIKTLVTVPMIYDGKCLGFVGFDAVTRRKDWSSEELALLRMLAELFTNAQVGKSRVEALEEARREAESAARLLSRAVEVGKAAIWETDEDNKQLHCVSGWAGLLGDPLDGTWIPVADFHARIHPDDLARVIEHVATAASSPGNSLQVRFRVRHREHRWVPVIARGFFEFAPEGRLLRISGSTVDVSETLLADEIARKRLEMDSKLLLISSGFVDVEGFDSAVDFALGEVGRFAGACRTHLVVLERERQLMNNTHEWCAPGISSEMEASQSMHLGLIRDALPKLEGGEAVYFPDVAAMDPAGGFVDLLLKQGIRSMVLVPLMAGGRMEGFLGLECTTGPREWAQEDVTMLRHVSEIIAGALARNRAELAIRSSEALHRTILNSLQEAVFMTDEAGRITFANQSWKSVTGIANERVIGLKLADLLNPADLREEEGRLKTLLGGEALPRYVIRFGTSEKDGRWLSLLRLPLLDAAGVSQGTLGAIMDVSDQRVWEENLIAAKIKAESANEAKTLYLSNLSHELRTPMHGVIGMLELMMEPETPRHKLHAHAADAHSSGISLLRLLDDILDIAKCEKGLIKLEEKPLNLKLVVEGMVAMVSVEAAKKPITLSCHVDPRVPTVFLGDELRCRQIIGNILKNAVTYTQVGTVAVSLSELPVPDGAAVGGLRRMVRIEVADTGIGIEEDKLSSVFEPFVQLTDSSHKNGGSGLGLAIVREIVELMGGAISLESTVGVGTTVRVDLPLVPIAHSGIAEEEPGGEQELGRLLKGMRVLVAEDNEINRVVARQHLEKLGCEVVTVVNGSEAVAACEQEFHPLVLMDCLMPVMDGFEASKRILANSTAERLPKIIGCTANASHQTTQMCLAAGMRSVLSKPYSRTQLTHALEACLVAPVAAAPAPARLLAGSEVFDPEVLLSLDAEMGGDERISPRLIAIFREEFPRQVAAIREAIAARDVARMKKAGHALKGSALTLGLNGLAGVCARISGFIGKEADATRLGELDRGLLEQQALALAALGEFEPEPLLDPEEPTSLALAGR